MSAYLLKINYIITQKFKHTYGCKQQPEQLYF